MFQHTAFSRAFDLHSPILGVAFAVGFFMTASPVQAQKPIGPDHAKKMSAGRDLFKSDIRTLLVGRCLKCHGGEKTEGGLDLSTREALLKGGDNGASIDMDTPQASRLMKLIRHEEEPVMPEDGAKLDDRQIQAFESWIRLGAPYDRSLVEPRDADPTAWTRKTIPSDARDFWTFQPWQNITVPKVTDNSWAKNDIDRFIWDKMQADGLGPNGTAPIKTLTRRASLDLIGLPPDQKLLELAESGNSSWERVVDSLLANEHFGERFARHWLDVARFAESFGFEQDYDRPNAYHYRDFVIRAMNRDMPYNQFCAWQLAGDELAPQDPEALMATGFIGAGVFPTQLTEKEFESARYDELDDMVATTGTAFLGLTVGCGRCHDHKFDPIPSRDYYQLVSVFRNTIRSNVEIAVNPREDQKRLDAWEVEQKQVVQALADFEANELAKRFDAVLADLRKNKDANPVDLQANVEGWRLPATSTVQSQAGATFTKQSDGSFLASGVNADSDRYTYDLVTLANKITGIRLDAINDPSMPNGGPGRAGNGNIGLSRIRVSAQPLDGSSPAVDVPLKNSIATFEQNNSSLSIASSLDENDQTGWAVDPQFNKPHAAAYQFANPVSNNQGTRLTVTLVFSLNKQHNIGRPRMAITQSDTLPPLDSTPVDGESLMVELKKFVQRNPGNGSTLDRKPLMSLYKASDARWQELQNAIVAHEASKPKPQVVTAMICSEGVKPIPNHGDDRGYPHFYPRAYFLKRGDVNQKQGEADTGFLQVLTSFASSEKSKQENDQSASEIDWGRWRVEPKENAKTSFRRAALANWLTDVEHGAGRLLARVMVNRVWQYHFGQGIVSTTNDFGFQGERPSHPELLDFLADRLIANGWKLKPIHKMIMMSATYQQASSFDSAKASIDPKNRLLWRFSPRRLEAEIIRDSILSVSGQLNPTMYGPGSMDEAMTRRSIYFFIKRSQLIPFMQVFDSPEPLVSAGQRPSTTIAPQALMFMNNRHVREWARAFAKRILAEKQGAVDQQIEHAYLMAIGRRPTDSEFKQSKSFLETQSASYVQESNSNPNEVALTDLCQILFSLNEFIYLD